MSDGYPNPAVPPSSTTGVIRAGLLGSGIHTSQSPKIHARAADLAGVNLSYELFDYPDDTDLGPLLERLHSEGYQGLNVTMPFKQRMGPHLRGMSPEAIATGSVNLLLRHEEGWIGENTDQEGFVQALVRRRLPFSRVLLLGNGGAAHSIMSALVSMPFVESIEISCRREEAAQALIDAHDDDNRPVRFLPMDGQPDPEMDLLINATPLGMEGHYPDSMPCPVEWLPQDGSCFDLVSMPRETPLLKAAKAMDMMAVPGLEMLVFQARRAFEGWTGTEFQATAILDELGL